MKRQEPGPVADDTLKGGNDETIEPDLDLKVSIEGKKGPHGRLVGRLVPPGAPQVGGSMVS